ncbi:MAG: glycine reductase [Clostridioides sp.]|jgi:glycine reductase|nr:glycine reductase [Clostridioides sp.]
MSKNVISDVLFEVADAIERGEFAKKLRIGLTTLGSEHGEENLMNGARLAKSGLFDIVLIGDKRESDEFEVVEVADEEEMHAKMAELLDSGFIDACVTMHHNFPIGVSTVGRVITPGRGREMIIATTTGTSATNRIEAMVRNAIAGIATAKSIGIEKPSVGILNVDGSRQVEKILKELQSNGYEIDFAESVRADGGCVMRGNDLIVGAPDIMVTDTLTGNLLMKVFSSFNTGGDYEAQGFGYGPGVGEAYDRKILIVSRASGAPVIANALKYAYEVSVGGVSERARTEFANAKSAKLDELISNVVNKESKPAEEVVAPNREVVTAQINGIDVMELEDAVQVLWKNGTYAESGMGCAGPIILVNEDKYDSAKETLIKSGYTAN